MNREIKFRAERIRDSQWTHGWLVIEDNGTAWISRHYHKGEWEQVNPETAGQFIRLRDQGKQEIYTGDIIQQFDLVFVVEDCPGGWHLKIIHSSLPSLAGVTTGIKILVKDYCKVIGNIHDNPELLELARRDTQ